MKQKQEKPVTKLPEWVGPLHNPLKAAYRALDAANVGTSELTTFGAWDAVGEYNFHEDERSFLHNLICWINDTYAVKVIQRDDGFYAMYTGGK